MQNLYRMIRLLVIGFIVFTMVGCQSDKPGEKQGNWKIAILPASVRLDPSTNKVIENRIQYDGTNQAGSEDLLKKNWVYDEGKAKIVGARGEYVSFQLALSIENSTDSVLNEISIEMPSFRKGDAQLKNKPEFFLEWSVKVNTPSTGYTKASLGKGWYPDALIPFHNIQADSSEVEGRWIYPLWLPDFNNRIDNQKSLLIWVDQFIPFKEEEAAPGKYVTSISVTIGEQTQQIPIELDVWDFAIPNENQFKASVQEEGFLSRMDEKQELQVYQLFKRNRMALMDPTYKPVLKLIDGNKVNIEWGAFDKRLAKYFTGEAFTEKYGYKDGPGYAEPIETFMLPFDVYGKHGTSGWPDIGNQEVEKDAANKKQFIAAIAEVRNHLLLLIDAKKTDLTVYLNGLDESILVFNKGLT